MREFSNRGWTESRVQEAISNPSRTVKWKDARRVRGVPNNEPATAYYHQGGGYVVRRDRDDDLVAVSDVFVPDWKAPWDIDPEIDPW